MSRLGSTACGALARLSAMLPVDPAVLTDAQLLGFVAEVEAVARQVEALRLAAAGEVQRRSDAEGQESLAHRLGFKTAAGAMQAITKSSGREAAKLVKDVQQLAKLPLVEQAVLEGRIGREAGAAIAGELGKAAAEPDGAAIVGAELAAAVGELVELAATVGADEVRAQAVEKAALLNSEVVRDRAATVMGERFFWVGPTVDGAARVSGLLPAGHAAVIRGVLDAFVNPKGTKTVTFTPDADDTPADGRTAGQKKADLLRDVFAAQARSAEAPDMGGDHPTVWISTTAAELEAGHGLAFYAGTPEPVPVPEAVQAACTGGTQAVVFEEDGNVLQLGRTVRAFTKRQRRAIALRDGGTCLIPGCQVPAQWCEVHHVTAHHDGGRTDVENGVNLCWYHHHDIHTGPWQIRMHDGTPETRHSYAGKTTDWTPTGHGTATQLRAQAPPGAKPLRPPRGARTAPARQGFDRAAS